MLTSGRRPKASGRQILALAFSPSAGLGPLSALGDSLALFLPGAPRLLKVIALTSYLSAGLLVLTIGSAFLAAGVGAPPFFALALLLAIGVYTTRTVAVARLFKVIMAQPLVAALMRASLVPPPADDQSESGPA